MGSLAKNEPNIYPEKLLNQKYKQRQALENAYSNFVEVHAQQWFTVTTSRPSTSWLELSCVSGWVLLTLIYCLMQKWQCGK